VPTETLSTREARRLALARAGLLAPRWSGLPARARGATAPARRAAHAVIERFGYLQLDTVSIAGARSHALVLMSRLEGLDPALGEDLLRPGAPLFEYWGHEASWLPMSLYPHLAFRRRAFRRHPWWGDLLGQHPREADALLRRIRDEGPLRSADLEGSSGGWWNLKLTRKLAVALWSSGALAVRARRRFRRTYDLAERVIPDAWRRDGDEDEGVRALTRRALAGHGWATEATLAATWRLRRGPVKAALRALADAGEVMPCALVGGARPTPGWIRPADSSSRRWSIGRWSLRRRETARSTSTPRPCSASSSRG